MTITSSFSHNAEGWKVLGKPSSSGFKNTGGDPGGYLEFSGTSGNTIFYYSAPAKYLGNQVASYGETLSYDIFDTGNNLKNSPDVELDGDGTLLYHEVSRKVGASWTDEIYTLSTGNGWINAETNKAATAAQFKDVLEHLTFLGIRAEYSKGDQSGGIDNIVLQTRGVTSDHVMDFSISSHDQIFLARQFDLFHPHGHIA